MLSKIKFIVKGSEVKRFHTIRTISEDTVGHHSFLVAMLCETLLPSCSKTLIIEALIHDLAEQVVGDIPSPVKAVSGEKVHELEQKALVKAGFEDYPLTDEEGRTLLLADRLAGLVYCRREIGMGNALILEAYRNYIDLVDRMSPFNSREQELIDVIKSL